MQTKRDQLRAYMFVVGRVKAALLRANPDAPSLPFKRSTWSTVTGVIVTVVVSGVLFVVGLLFPGNSDSWRAPGSVVIAKESGARYLFVGGVLHPVLNFTSAKLVLGPGMGVSTVSEKSLAGTPRGVPLGIPGAPDALPPADRLLTEPPMACSQPPAASAAAGSGPRLVVAAGYATAAQPEDGAVLVADPSGAVHLAWQGQRFRIADPKVPGALGLTGDPRPVPLSWLNTLLPRADLFLPDVPGRGEASVDTPELGVLRSGQVLAVDAITGGRRYLIALPDGLAPIDELTAALVLGDPRTAAAYPGTVKALPVSGAAVAAARESALGGVPGSWPDSVPQETAAGADDALCTVLPAAAGPDQPPRLLTAGAAELAAAVGVPRDADRDLIAVQPGSALLARVAPVPGVDTGAVYLVTDLGVRHLLPTTDAVTALGYAPQAAVGVSAELLDGIAQGPALDPAAARAPQITATQ